MLHQSVKICNVPANLPAPTGLVSLRRVRLQSPTVIQLSGNSDILTGICLTKIGTYTHPQYKQFSITAKTLADMIRNFNTGVYGQKIFIDVAHKPEDGAAAEIVRLYQDGDWLKADIQLSEFGRESITKRKYIYLSVDYADNWQDPETQADKGAVLFGAGLTIRPFIKHQPGIALAEPTGANRMSHREKFLNHLRSITAGEALTKALTEQYDSQAKALGEDVTALDSLVKQLSAIADAAVKQLADQPTPQNITLNIPAASTGMSIAEVEKLLADRETARQLAETTTAKKLSDNRAAFAKALDEAQGLSEDTRKLLAEAADLVTGDMSADQVKKLAEFQINQGNRLEISRQLTGLGFNVVGSTRVTLDESNNIKNLSETVKKALKETNAYSDRRLRLAETPDNLRVVNRALAEFDRVHAFQLQQEHRILSGSPTNMGSAFLPASFTREVIREALADLNILQLVRTSIDPNATTTTQIPYEVLTSASSIPNGGMVTEGSEIPFAGAGIKSETAYVRAMKLALKVTNEIMHFTQSSGVNWNAWGENIASNARIMRELIHLRIANEIQRSADTYMAVPVTNEAFTASATGLIKTALFPVVRPYQDYDLQGNAINLPECPLAITIAGAAIKYYTGETTLAAGTYWQFSNINLGYIQLVNQVGAVAGASATGTISYYNPTNLIKFDLNPAAGVDYRKNLNLLLSAVGDQKAMLSSQRYSRPEYALMSSMLNNEMSKAEQFVLEFKRNGTNDNVLTGDLESIKGLPSFDCNAPGMDLGDQRILLGQRGLTGYTIIKPFSVGIPFEAVGVNGRPTGEKVAYGEEYNALYTPKAIRKRYTSVLVYNSTTR